ncbi:hypothetical protein AB0B86_13120 [Micromonospora sp. NPDC049047]|uniref:hypothetical protein n=1 Tax=Micromonospora sp. NPDC049047 TaxID=3155645 RepID=UPI00340F5BD3
MLMLDVADKISSVVAAAVAIMALVVAMRQGGRPAHQIAAKPAVETIEYIQNGDHAGQHGFETNSPGHTFKRSAGIQIIGAWMMLVTMLYVAMLYSYPEFQVLANWNVDPQTAIYRFISSGSLFILTGCLFVVLIYRELSQYAEPNLLYWQASTIDWTPLMLSQGVLQFTFGALLIPAITYVGWAGRSPARGNTLIVAALTLATSLAVFLSFQEFRPLIEDKVRLEAGDCLDVSKYRSDPKSTPCSHPSSGRITAIIYPWNGASRCSKQEGSISYGRLSLLVCFASPK